MDQIKARRIDVIKAVKTDIREVLKLTHPHDPKAGDAAEHWVDRNEHHVLDMYDGGSSVEEISDVARTVAGVPE